MKIGILGSGIVGRSHATKLVKLGYEVMIGTRDIKNTLEKSNDFKEWYKDNSEVDLGTFEETSIFSEIVINALNGKSVIDVLKSIESNLSNKILIDISNPLDFSTGELMLFISNNDSLGENIQRELPNVKVVKTLNTINASLQVEPNLVQDSDHHVFIGGNDSVSKEKVKELLKEYGWENIIDLGDIKTSRGVEMILPLWLLLFKNFNSPKFNFKIVK